MVAGRNQPPAGAMEAMARALWSDDPVPLDLPGVFYEVEGPPTPPDPPPPEPPPTGPDAPHPPPPAPDAGQALVASYEPPELPPPPIPDPPPPEPPPAGPAGPRPPPPAPDVLELDPPFLGATCPETAVTRHPIAAPPALLRRLRDRGGGCDPAVRVTALLWALARPVPSPPPPSVGPP
jgi:hypothetical protein